MDRAETNKNNSNAIPAAFRGLQVLLVDSDTETLLNTALMLEGYSYKVTTTELASVALSILQERRDQYDIIMADFDIPEMDGLKFIERVQLVKDFPMLLMSSELKKDVVKEAMAKGACYFIRKPISPGKVRDVWQHVYKRRRLRHTKDQEIVTEREEIIECKGDNNAEGCTVGDQENENVPFDYQIKNNLDKLFNEKEGSELSEICIQKSLSTENDESELKRKRTKMASRDFEQENSRNMKAFGDEEKCPEAEGIQVVIGVPNSEELSKKFEGEVNSSYLAQEFPVPAPSESMDSTHFLMTFKSLLQQANIGKEENQFQTIDNTTVELGETKKATNVQPTASDIEGSEEISSLIGNHTHQEQQK